MNINQDLIISFTEPALSIKQKEDKLQIQTKESVSVVTPLYHKDFLGLDYENSGHTGFASEKQLSVLVPKNLSVFPKSTLKNRNAKIYLDNDGTAEQSTIQDVFNLKLRTVSEIPQDIQTGDYIFLEINKNNG